MKLILYSGGEREENTLMDKALQNMLSKNPQITYIPACDYQTDIAFRDFIERFDHIFHRFVRLPVDEPITPIIEEEAFKSEIIYLDGGNTYYLLNWLKKKKLLSRLKQFVKQGGILCGQSAGAIVMSPTIASAGMPDFDKDENDVQIKNISALNLVDFDIFPHYKNSLRYEKALLAYSKTSKIPLYAFKDGSGIVIHHNQTMFVGGQTCFYKGHKFSF